LVLADSKVLIGVPAKDENLKRAAMNLEKVKTMIASVLNVYDLLKYDYLILTVDAIPVLEEAFLK